MADQIDFVIAELEDYTRGEIIALALNVNANLREDPSKGGTPIDTGWASANWVPSVGEPYSDPGIQLVKRPTAQQVIARQQIADAGLNDLLSWRNNDGPLLSTNNVPYILPLNNGHSLQAPAGFVQAAIEKAIRQTYSRAASFASRGRRAAAARLGKARPGR